MNMWLMYLVLKLDDVNGLLTGVLVALSLVVLFGGLALMASYGITSGDYGNKDFIKHIFPKLLKIYKRIIIALVVISCLTVIIPTTKQAAAIYFVPKVINNKQVRKMPNKLVTLANSWMDEQIKSIKSE